MGFRGTPRPLQRLPLKQPVRQLFNGSALHYSHDAVHQILMHRSDRSAEGCTVDAEP